MATASVEDIKLEDIPVDDIDFSDLEEQFNIDSQINFDNFVVVDGAPIAPESKVPVLTKVLTKLFSQAGNIVDINLPLDEEKKSTKGYLFIEFDSAVAAKKAIKLLNGKKLDVKHRLFVNSLNDVEKYGTEEFDTEFHEPKLPEFNPTEYLRSWLQDENGRDQFVLQKGDMTGVFWNRNAQQPENVVEPRKNWSNTTVKFSPKGTYLFSFHNQGVASWGGKNFDRLQRFFHPQTKALSVSPTEKYLVTLSPQPIEVPEDAPEDFPFGPESNGHQLCVWDIATGVSVKTFALPPGQKLHWPMIKWSFDDKYCARLGPNALAVYDTENNFELLGGKVLKIDGIVDFSFAPTGVKLAVNRNNELSSVLAYWTPESNNQSCKATIMEIPTRRILRTVNLVQVSDVTLHWQNQSEYLCVKVDRHTKSKKTLFTNLEICKLTEKEVPVEKVEMKDHGLRFAWEPKGNRFITVSVTETADDNPSIPKNVVTFYAPEQKDKKAVKKEELTKWIPFAKVEGQFSNTISWSPAGRFVVVATLVTPDTRKADFDFYDLDFTGEKSLNNVKTVAANLMDVAHPDYFSATDMQWDPSGRYVAVWSSATKHKLENGYKVFNIAGDTVREEMIDGFQNFVWRPRPETLLTNGEKKKVRKNLREWSAQFEEQDAMQADSAMRELILARRSMLEEWTQYRENNTAVLEEEYGFETYDTIVLGTSEEDFQVVEEIKEEILEEKEEEVDSFEETEEAS
ncbi:LAFE_0D12398g1_1 [Lachancea fermentati]|uniref:Eukaryotic translation initiation factor 3 subunit B n=1 Tax=Lachancea fermentati TaxID=4955 RepID=A0A1G4MC61_LACFM|nr:LAFE_0D12398g1_1 [Lachancea fermentati]